MLSYEFDRPIEIYKFGATAWPRAIIVAIVVAALGQLYWHWRFGDAGLSEALSVASQDESGAKDRPSLSSVVRLTAILALPILYAWLLEPVGFYSLTLFFIAAFIVLLGERRWQWVLGVSVGIYCGLVLLFAKLLYVGLPVGNLRPFYDFANWLLVLLR